MINQVILIQLSSTEAIGLAACRKNGSWRVQWDFRLPLCGAPDDPHSADWGTRLRHLLKRKKYSTQGIILVLGRQDYAVTSIPLPPGTPAETASMLELDLAERLPADPARICHGWETVETGEDGRQLIQVYWSPREKIDAVLDDLGKNGLKLIGIFPSLALYRRLFLPQYQNRPLVLLHDSSEFFEYAGWASGGALLFSRGKKHLTGSLPDDGSGARTILTELAGNAGVALAQSQPDGGHFLIDWRSNPGDAKLPSELVGEPHPAAERLKQATGKLKSELPLDFILLAGATELLPVLLSQSHSGSLASPLSMLPRQLIRRSEWVQLRRLATQSATLVLGILLLASGNLWLYSALMAKQLDANQEEIKRLTPEVKEIEGMEQRIASIKDQLDYAISPVDALRAVNALLAKSGDSLEGLYLDHMNYLSSGEIIMEGHTTSDITPWKFAEDLGQTGAFRITQKPRIETHMLGGTRSIRFNLKVQARADDSPARVEGDHDVIQ